MATTTSKSPHVIKSDIRRVLDRMQVQYREVKGGFECLHAPSIDLSSVGGGANLNGHSHAASGSADSGPKRTVVRKTSKLSILRKGKEKEKDEEQSSSSGAAPINREKELPHRPISSAVAATSTSSTYLNVPDAVPEDEDKDNTPTATKEGSPVDKPVEVSLEEESTSNHTLTREEQTPKATSPPVLDAPNPNHGTIRPKHLPQVPRERSRSPPPAAEPRSDKNDMSVRFDINIVKVCEGGLRRT